MKNFVELKLSNVINNLDIFSKLIDRKYINTDVESTVNEIVEDLIFNPSILEYFNYSENEKDMIYDVITNGFEYPGVKEDFINELIRKNELNLNFEKTIFNSVKEYYNLNNIETNNFLKMKILNSRKNNIQLNLKK